MGQAEPAERRHRGRSTVRFVLSVALAVVVYYLVPVSSSSGAVEVVLRVTGSVVGLAVVTWLIFRQMHRQIAASDEARLENLLLAIVIGVLALALADHVLATVVDGQFAGLRTRTDALYFAVSTLVTVGFGDVHAVGQVARVLVIVQMLFNVIVIASAVSLFSRRLREVRAHQDRSED